MFKKTRNNASAQFLGFLPENVFILHWSEAKEIRMNE